MIPRILERLEKARQQFTWAQLCYRLIPCATVLRWRARTKAGQPLLEKAGPKKQQPLAGQLLGTRSNNCHTAGAEPPGPALCISNGRSLFLAGTSRNWSLKNAKTGLMI